MMNISIVCVGKLKERYWTEACAEYSKRLRGTCNFSIVEVDEEKMPEVPSHSSIKNTLEKEGKRLLSAVPKGAFIFAMCIEGRQLSSEKLKQLYLAQLALLRSEDNIFTQNYGIGCVNPSGTIIYRPQASVEQISHFMETVEGTDGFAAQNFYVSGTKDAILKLLDSLDATSVKVVDARLFRG